MISMQKIYSAKVFRLLCLIACVAVCATVMPPRPAHSQGTLKIAAVVNDEIVSVYDLSQRILLVIAFSNLPNTPQNQQRIAPEVLRRLIIERLRLQEAKRLEIEVPEAAIKRSIADMEKQRNIPPGKMDAALLQKGIDPETLHQQVLAELAWIDIVRALFRRLVTVSEQEVDDVMERMRQNAGKPEYLLGEIFLAYDEKPRSEVEQVAQRLHAQLGAGASWPEIAQNFSESASAERGGDMGWNLAEDLGPVLGGVVSRLQPGQMSSPISTDDGIYLMLVRDKRVAKGIEINDDDLTLGIHQLHLPIPQNADPQTIAGITAKARELAASADTCKAFASIASSAGSKKSGFLGKFKLDQLNPQFRSMVETLNANEISQPLRTADGVIVLMVCSRESQGAQDPIAAARANIEARILNRRLSRMAAQHEEKLRRQAFIDVRL